MEITQLQHPDFIWTWKESKSGRRQSLYLPYIQNITITKEKNKWRFDYNGGSLLTNLKEVDTIFFYGATSTHIPLEFLDECNQNNISILLHRRNQASPYIFTRSLSSDSKDLLTQQILVRENEIKNTYIARTLIREKLHASEYLITISDSTFNELKHLRDIKTIRLLEAKMAQRYWDAYFSQFQLDTSRRQDNHPINQALDALSHFMTGILLRWVLFHKLSPYHGFLHQPSQYTALVYDLIEPYRHWIDQAVTTAWQQGGEEQLTERAIHIFKEQLEELVYVPVTHQTVRRKSLLHGIVLSLRAYLLNEQARFLVPQEGKKLGGRPPKVVFSIPGYQ